MKLKLEQQDSITILCVTEDLTSQHAAILKAGLSKLLLSGKKLIILDLTGVTDADPAILKDLSAIQELVSGTDSRLVIASHVAGIGQAANREEAIQQFTSPLGILLSTETRLTTRIAQLEATRAHLLKSTQASGVSDAEAKLLMKENSSLKQTVRELETQISQILSKRVELKAFDVMKARAESIQNTLTSVLEQEGVLPIR